MKLFALETDGAG